VDVDNNKPPAFSIGTPANGTSHQGTVRVAGTAVDKEGFGQGWKVQYSLDRVSWTDVAGGVLLDDRNMDYEVELDLSYLPKGNVEILVRVSDGDKFSEPKQVNVEMDNRPDLHIDLSSVSWEPEKPVHGGPVFFTLRVENRGVVTAEAYEVELRRGSQVVGLAAGSNLPTGESENLLVMWDARGGNNTLRFWVDSKEDLDELDESNNKLDFNVKVKKPDANGDGDGPSLRDIILIVGVIAGLTSVGLAGLKWYMLNRPPPPEPVVETVYEGGGLYDEHGPYGEDHMTDADEGPPSERIGGPGAQGIEGSPTTQSEDWQTTVKDQPEGNVAGAKESGHTPLEDRGGQDTSGYHGVETSDGSDAPQPVMPEHGIGPDETPDTPSLDAKDNEQLTQDVDIRPEKVERA
jgi:hypothetical protein